MRVPLLFPRDMLNNNCRSSVVEQLDNDDNFGTERLRLQVTIPGKSCFVNICINFY